MNNAKLLTKIIMAGSVLLVGLFYQFTQTLLADSYVSGGSTPTLQAVVDTGSTASGTITLNANNTSEALACSHGAGPNTGHCIEITDHTGSGAGLKANTTGAGHSVLITKTGTGAGLHVTQSGTGVGENGAAGYFQSTNANAPAVSIWGNSYATLRISQNGAFEHIWGSDGAAAAGNILTFAAWPTGGSSGNTLLVSRWGNLSIGNGVTLDTTNMIFASGTVSTGGMLLRNTKDDALGINLTFERAPIDSGVLAGDVIGQILFNDYQTATSTQDTYANIKGSVVTASATPDGKLDFIVVDSGTDDTAMTITGGTDMITMGYPLTATSLQFADEAMDTYNEGTYTPLLSGLSTAGVCTATTTYGFYTQVGNVVNVDINMAIANCDPNPTGIMRVSLPVAPNSNASYRTGCAIGLLSTYTLSAAGNIMTPTITNGGYVLLRETVVGGGTYADAPLDETFTLQMHCTYLTD